LRELLVLLDRNLCGQNLFQSKSPPSRKEREKGGAP
jgi:hypothetical protein